MPSAASLEIRECGYIIRTHRLSDTSIIVEWLTQNQGRVATVARGALRKKSALAGKLDLLFHAAISYRRSRRSDLHQLKEVSLLSTPVKLRRSISRLNQVAYFVDLIRRSTEADTPVPEIYELFHRAITLAEGAKLGPNFILWFEWKLLDQLGIQPTFSDRTAPDQLRQLLHYWNQTDEADVDMLKQIELPPQLASILGHAWIQEIGKCPKLRGPLLSGL
jgi:DNA repair protein RecO (recombination protein O)